MPTRSPMETSHSAMVSGPPWRHGRPSRSKIRTAGARTAPVTMASARSAAIQAPSADVRP